MAIPTDRAGFKQYVLRKLGAPVIQINVADEQVDDRVDEALSFFCDYHYNGATQEYLKHEVTESEAAAGYIELPDNILGVTRIFDLGVGLGAGMWNVNYQFALQNINDLVNGRITDYYMTMMQLEFLQEWLVGKPLIRYNRHQNRLFIDMASELHGAGTILVIDCYAVLDQEEFTKIWSDRWLQNYAAALVAENWGNNLKKFSGVQLMGGIQFNGERILADALSERQRLEDEAINSLQPLVHNFVG